MDKPVLTGQQIGLLGGPLYTTYKVFGAIHLASENGGQAVYWLETNDADFNEINHINYLDRFGKLQTLRWEIDTRGYSCGYIQVDSALVDILKTFFSTIHQTEFTGDLKEMVLSSYMIGNTLGEASRLLAEKLFHDFPLEIFDPMDQKFRDFSKSILIEEANRTPEGSQCNLFCIIDKKRLAVFKKDGHFELRDGTEVDLTELDLVPNVKTRNVCQDAFFKNDFYVAGPGEMAYISQLKEFYDFHGVRKAEPYPRMSVTLIEPRVVRSLQNVGLGWEEFLVTSAQELVNRKLAEISDYDFSNARNQTKEWTDDYLKKMDSLSLHTKNIRKALQKLVKDSLGEKRAEIKTRHNKLITEVSYLSYNIYPYGKKQERVFNIFYYMNLYGGVKFLQWLFDRYDPNKSFLEINHG